MGDPTVYGKGKPAIMGDVYTIAVWNSPNTGNLAPGVWRRVKKKKKKKEGMFLASALRTKNAFILAVVPGKLLRN